ncbi:MAG: ArsA-related P-loop ATPase [Thermoleophilia bacterium]
MPALARCWGQSPSPAEATTPPAAPEGGSLPELIDRLADAGHGVVMTMGKGGAGTTIAAAIAMELAHRGHRVHLSTTDPAAHVEAAIGDGRDGLRVSRIDPAAETRTYTDEVMRQAGSGLSADARALLEEDLRSPCTEEIAVFRAFARTVADGEDGFVVLDTAPTGHTLLLLDAAEAYHRDVGRTQAEVPDDVRRLLPRLRDPQFTRVLIITLPEATPVHEAARLADDLERAGITPYTWVVNQSLATAGVTDPTLQARARREHGLVAEVQRLAEHVVVVPWQPGDLVGARGLGALATC